MDNNATNVNKKNGLLPYIIILIILAICVFVGPIVFVILGTAGEVQGDKFVNPFERQYILSVCIVTLIVCGTALVLMVSSLIYKTTHKKVNG